MSISHVPPSMQSAENEIFTSPPQRKRGRGDMPFRPNPYRLVVYGFGAGAVVGIIFGFFVGVLTQAL